MSNRARESAAPAWLAPATLAAMAMARQAAEARRLPAVAVAEAMREVVLARHPALPASLLAEAVAALLPPPARSRRLPRRAPVLPGWPPRP